MHNSTIDSLRAEADEPLNKSSRSKKIIFIIVRTLVTIALIYWILKDTKFNEIIKSISVANFMLTTLAFFLHFVGYYISALRWKILLKAQNVNAKIWYLIKSYMVAIFFNNFLPTTIGGDTVRAYDSYRVGKSKSGAVAVIFVDRFLGLFALMIFALTAIFFVPEIRSAISYLFIWVILGLAGMGCVLFIIFFPSKKITSLITKIRIPFSRKLQQIAEKIINAFLVFKGKKKVLIIAILLSIALQANVVTYYFVISASLDFPIPYYNFFLIVPLAIFIMMLPVSINGIGLRENVFFFFLALFAVTKTDAIAFAWIEYGILLLQGVGGGLVYALRK